MNEEWEVQSASSDERSERRLWLNAFMLFANTRESAREAAAEASEAVRRYREAFGGGK